ncbi:MAG: PbsX family transcriptional regulator [Desulfobacterales bacterium]|nr:PbsX family transcriptional regulator [Desulfobacterales bacterium]
MEKTKLHEGDDLDICEGNIVLRSVRKKYTLEELVSNITPKNKHKEINFGKSVGKEMW